MAAKPPNRYVFPAPYGSAPSEPISALGKLVSTGFINHASLNDQLLPEEHTELAYRSSIVRKHRRLDETQYKIICKLNAIGLDAEATCVRNYATSSIIIREEYDRVMEVIGDSLPEAQTTLQRTSEELHVAQKQAARTREIHLEVYKYVPLLIIAGSLFGLIISFAIPWLGVFSGTLLSLLGVYFQLSKLIRHPWL